MNSGLLRAHDGDGNSSCHRQREASLPSQRDLFAIAELHDRPLERLVRATARMQRTATPTRFRELDDLAISALVSHQPKAPGRPSDTYASIEVLPDEPLDVEELVVTHRFVRFSAPYERIDLDLAPSAPTSPLRRSRPTTFVRTVRTPSQTVHASATALPTATLSFDQKWFAQPVETLAAISDDAIPAQRSSLLRSWRWLAISVAAGAVAVGAALIAL